MTLSINSVRLAKKIRESLKKQLRWSIERSLKTKVWKVSCVSLSKSAVWELLWLNGLSLDHFVTKLLTRNYLNSMHAYPSERLLQLTRFLVKKIQPISSWSQTVQYDLNSLLKKAIKSAKDQHSVSHHFAKTSQTRHKTAFNSKPSDNVA